MKLPQLYEKVEDGKYSIEALIIVTADGIGLIITGGEKEHLGTVVVCYPRESLSGDKSICCTTSIINRISHKDDILIIPIAEALCKKTNSFITATGGIHIDNADESEIKRLMDNAEHIKKKVLMKF